MKTAEVKIRKWIIDNNHIKPCTREESKKGCLACQELYRLLDAHAQSIAIEFAEYLDELPYDNWGEKSHEELFTEFKKQGQ